MVWLQLTLDQNNKRHINLDKFVFIQPDKDGSYLVCMEKSHSVRVQESPARIDALLKRVQRRKLFGLV